MGYKGGDLDLRTPLGLASPATAEPAAGQPRPLDGREAFEATAGAARRAAPIWVDETVMACCNKAFELASAHRAEQVRIDHLVHAATLVEAAAARLEQHGTPVPALRRETAAGMAGDEAADRAGAGVPGRSVELEQLLHAAGRRAYSRQRPVEIDDVIVALLDWPGKAPGLDLLRQPASIAGAAPAASLLGSDGETGRPRERVRVAALSQHTAGPAAADRLPREAGHGEDMREAAARLPPGVGPREIEKRPYRSQPLAVLERTGLARGVHTAGLAIAADSLRAIESFNRKFGTIEDALTAVVDRLAGIERGMDDKAAREGADADLLAAQLAAVEQALAALPATAYPRDMDARFEVLEARGNDVATGVALMDERLAAVETAAWAHKGLGERLHAEIASLAEKLARQREEIANAVSAPVLERIAAVDATVGQRLADGLGAVERIGEQLVLAESGIRAEIAALAGSLRPAEEGALAAAHAPLLERVATIDTSLRTNHAEGLGALRLLDDRLAQIEAAVAALARTAPGPVEDRLGPELGRLHEDLATINANQKTIAAGMDLWRENTLADLSTVGDRLEALEKLGFRTAQFMEALLHSVQELHGLAIRGEERRNRLGKWLFGLDDAFSTGWKPGAVRGQEGSAAGERQPAPSPAPEEAASGGVFGRMRRLTRR